jgi:hypothetical protein
MASSANSNQENPFGSPVDQAAARLALNSVSLVARAGVVNRTHRVIRQRARAMQARRSRVRGLLAPMIICSALLLLIAVAVWSGFYQNPANAAELVQTDVAGPAASAVLDSSNHSLVALLWFLPVGLAVPALVLYRRKRESVENKAGR